LEVENEVEQSEVEMITNISHRSSTVLVVHLVVSMAQRVHWAVCLTEEVGRVAVWRK
jgi:hypothetical protein